MIKIIDPIELTTGINVEIPIRIQIINGNLIGSLS
jgi:hypothetical protein